MSWLGALRERSRDLLPEVPVAPPSGQPMGVPAELRHGVEHLLDAGRMPGVRLPVADDTVPRVLGAFPS
jgi:hypothetical protein